jgi:hypothetical protein
MVLLGDDAQAAIVACDLTGIAVDLSSEIRRRAAEKSGIPAENIIVCGTHSHTVPDYTKDLYELLTERAAAAPDDRKAYAATLIDRIVEAIVEAHASAAPSVIHAGSAVQETPVSFNRRFVMRDGSVQTWQSASNPAVVRPAGPIDPQIGLLSVREAASEKPLCVFGNFALHLDTVGGTQWSADYPFYIEQKVRESLGSEVISLFGLGCCGDINHIDPTRTERNTTEFIGNSLGATVSRSLSQIQPIAKPKLQVRSTVVQLPLREVSETDARRSAELLGAVRNGVQADFFDQVTAYRDIMLDQLRHKPPHIPATEHISWGATHTWAGIGETLPVDVHVVTLGSDAALVFLPGEVFVELGLAIKQASPFRTTLVVELSQCVETVYIPTRAAYAGGSYEVTNSTLQPGGGEMLVEAAVSLLRQSATAIQQAEK